MKKITSKTTNEIIEAQEVKRSAGRPKRTDGKENRSRKFSLYLPPTIFQSLDELSRFYGRSVTDIIIELSEAYIAQHKNELDLFREAREKALNQAQDK